MVLNINLYESNVQNFTSTFHLFSEHQTVTWKVFWASPCGCLIEISHLTPPRENSCFALQFLSFSSLLLHLRKWYEPPTKASGHLWSPSFFSVWQSNLKAISESVLTACASLPLHHSKPVQLLSAAACLSSVLFSRPTALWSEQSETPFRNGNRLNSPLIAILQCGPNAQEWISKPLPSYLENSIKLDPS